MTSNARITVDNVIDRTYCDITSTVAPVATFQLNYLKDPDRAKWLRILSPTSIDIKFTWGGDSVVVNMCSMNRTNSEPADTDRFRAYASSDWTGPAIVDTTVLQSVPSLTLGDLAFGIDPLGSNLFDSFIGQKMNTRFFAEQTIGSAILTIDATSNAQGWFDMSRFFLGKSYTLEANPVYGAGLRWNHNDIAVKRMKGGSQLNLRGTTWREYEFNMAMIKDTDARMWFAAARLKQTVGDFHFTIAPDDSSGASAEDIRDYTGLWTFQKLPGIIKSSYARNDSSTLLVET